MGDSGNWTNTDGSLLATLVPGIGGEQGYIDSNGLFQLDVRYVVQFASDKKFGYVQAKGVGKAGGSNKVALSVSDVTTLDIGMGLTNIILLTEM